MSKYISVASSIVQKLTRSKWTTLKLNKKGDVTLFTADGKPFILTVAIKASGMKPGDTLQVRGYIGSYKKGTKTTIDGYYPIHEVNGTIGKTMAVFPVTGKAGKGKSGRSNRIRIMAWTDGNGVKIEKVNVKGLKG